jgi:TonB family protein
VSGSVVLRVLLKVDGTVEVLSVLHSLGYGMDESAEKSALGIRFEPETVDGIPTNRQAEVTVQFDIS